LEGADVVEEGHGVTGLEGAGVEEDAAEEEAEEEAEEGAQEAAGHGAVSGFILRIARWNVGR
jgi:hypothetical protein